MWALRAILVAIIVIAIVAFALFNVELEQRVDVKLWKTFYQVSLVEVIFWSFVSGLVLSLIIFISVYIRMAVNLRTVKKQIRALESEVTVLRNRPIEESAELLHDEYSKDQKE
ncbi:MAG: lipopolysaccharide assembly protein LapA domain-containing protein [bacterium]